MYKVMLVDDENLILEGLKHIIDWESINVEIVDTAENGQQAIEKFKKNPMDIIITDINMPIVSGLELLKEINEINKEVEFVILSGYDDFSYAQKAIELGVESYILKPVDEDKLESVIKKIIARKEKDNDQKERLITKNLKLLDFLDGKNSIYSLEEINDILYLDFNSNKFTTALISYENKDINIKEMKLIPLLKELNDSFEIAYEYNGRIALINWWDKCETDEGIKNYYDILKYKMQKKLECNVFIGVGSKVSSVGEIKKSYKIAKELNNYLLTEGFNKVLFEEFLNTTSESDKGFKDEMDRINKLIVAKNADKVKESLKEIINNEDMTPKNIYDFSIRMVILIDNIYEEFQFEKKFKKEGLSNIILGLCKEGVKKNITRFLESETEELIKLMDCGEVKFSPVIQQVLNLVNEEYKNDLSLKTLGYKFNINSSYLGQLFTKEVGSPFSKYLTQIKNSKAKELILNTNMKINDIATEVGYSDTSYFYRKFKKCYGVCPSTLREMKNY